MLCLEGLGLVGYMRGCSSSVRAVHEIFRLPAAAATALERSRKGLCSAASLRRGALRYAPFSGLRRHVPLVVWHCCILQLWQCTCQSMCARSSCFWVCLLLVIGLFGVQLRGLQPNCRPEAVLLLCSTALWAAAAVAASLTCVAEPQNAAAWRAVQDLSCCFVQASGIRPMAEPLLCLACLLCCLRAAVCSRLHCPLCCIGCAPAGLQCHCCWIRWTVNVTVFMVTTRFNRICCLVGRVQPIWGSASQAERSSCSRCCAEQ